MSAPRGRIQRTVDGTPLRYAIGGSSGPGARQSARADRSIVGDAYARVRGAKGRVYLGPVRSSTTSDGRLVLRFTATRLPVSWESADRGLELELELEPTEALDGELEEQPTARMRRGA